MSLCDCTLVIVGVLLIMIYTFGTCEKVVGYCVAGRTLDARASDVEDRCWIQEYENRCNYYVCRGTSLDILPYHHCICYRDYIKVISISISSWLSRCYELMLWCYEWQEYTAGITQRVFDLLGGMVETFVALIKGQDPWHLSLTYFKFVYLLGMLLILIFLF